MTEKIQKVLANAGLGSRRQIEEWLTEGRVSVRGQKAKLGDRMEPDDKVRVDGHEVKLLKTTAKKCRVLLYHKPEGEICSRSDPEKRPTIFDHLPLLRNSRWITVGRLDFNTSGVLLLTNDGELAHRLMHPSTQIEREYAVRIKGDVTPEMLKLLKTGVELDDGEAKFEQIYSVGGEGTNHWYHVLVKQGRNRFVRRLWESQGVMVSRLIRVRFGSVTLPRGLRRGKWQDLVLDEIDALLEPVGMTKTDAIADAVLPTKATAAAPQKPLRRAHSPVQRSDRSAGNQNSIQQQKPAKARGFSEDRKFSRDGKPGGAKPAWGRKPADRDERAPRSTEKSDWSKKPARSDSSSRAPKPEWGNKPARGERASSNWGDKRPPRDGKPAAGGKSWGNKKAKPADTLHVFRAEKPAWANKPTAEKPARANKPEWDNKPSSGSRNPRAGKPNWADKSGSARASKPAWSKNPTDARKSSSSHAKPGSGSKPFAGKPTLTRSKKPFKDS
jgi:23S rRNA pseudouridine2605 synthase